MRGIEWWPGNFRALDGFAELMPVPGESEIQLPATAMNLPQVVGKGFGLGDSAIGGTGSEAGRRETMASQNEKGLRRETQALEFFGGRYWDRTSDPCRVKAVLYR